MSAHAEYTKKRKVYFSIQDRFVRKRESFSPFLFEIEPTTDCNVSCVFCPRSRLERSSGRLSPEDFIRVLENLHVPPEGSMLLFSGFGEPLLHERILSLVSEAKKRGWFCGVTTNGTLLSRKRIVPLLDSGLDVLQVSVHAFSKHTYQRHVKGGSFRRTVENIQSILPLCRDRTILALNFTMTPWNREETRAFADFWKPQGDICINFSSCHNRGGALDKFPWVRITSVPGPEGTCWVHRHTVFVTWEGGLLACCNDLTGDTVRGDLRSQRLDDILKRESAQEKGPWFKLCRDCDFPFR